MALIIVQGWGPGTWKTYCDDSLGVRARGWGAGRPWKMFHIGGGPSNRLQGIGGGPQWKLFCGGQD